VQWHDGSAFWAGNRAWLLGRGFQLYDVEDPPVLHEFPGRYWLSPTNASPLQGKLPWAKVARTAGQQISFRTVGRIAPARDSSGRDVILKAIGRNDQENVICKSLLGAVEHTDPSTFPCIVPPLAVLDTPYDYSIVSMPRWGKIDWIDDIDSPRECLRFIDCMLRSLVFLHARRIAHLDIITVNILADYFRLDNDAEALETDVRERRNQGDIEHTFALIDFDASMQLPINESLRTCRGPASEFIGNRVFPPDDMIWGAPFCNPFAYDVGSMGNIFRRYWAPMAAHVPSLAPLFDRMTTHVLHERFTAEEALCFVRDTTSHLSAETLDAKCSTELNWSVTSDAYWSRLSPQDQATWRRHRTPPLPWWTPILEWLLQTDTAWCAFAYVRRLLGV
ncbi:uncharacterized protein BXZ73DRAFT_39566, partial [Epithele typhae]|uniref:uncharacterized protein n=2 Tax=Epithele typhae TaxID=378194 RepID=UPI002007C60E